MGNGTRQTLADPLAPGKAADNKQAGRIDEIIGRLPSRDAHGEHAVQLSGALLRPIHGRTDVEALLSVAWLPAGGRHPTAWGRRLWRTSPVGGLTRSDSGTGARYVGDDLKPLRFSRPVAPRPVPGVAARAHRVARRLRRGHRARLLLHPA